MRREKLYELLETAERHQRAGRLRRAVAFYRKVLSVARDDESEWELAHVRLGLLHMRQDQVSKAVPHLMRAHALAPHEDAYALWLGQALNRVGQPFSAARVLIDICHSPVCGTSALIDLARAAADLGERVQAREILTCVAKQSRQPQAFPDALTYCQDA